MTGKKEFSCSTCGAIWQKSGATHCWSSDPKKKPIKPAYCPTNEHDDVIRESFDLYKGHGEDAKMARTAARFEGMCYQPVPGSDAINARWTRVEDTIAFARLMDYQKIGLATCIGLLNETHRLAAILKAQGFTR